MIDDGWNKKTDSSSSALDEQTVDFIRRENSLIVFWESELQMLQYEKSLGVSSEHAAGD